MPKNRNQTSAQAGSALLQGIVTSQALAGAGALTIDGTLSTGGVATLTPPQNVVITSGGNDSGITFTISGTDYGGSAISEVLTGASGAAVTSVYLYATVTSIVASGAVATT